MRPRESAVGGGSEHKGVLQPGDQSVGGTYVGNERRTRERPLVGVVSKDDPSRGRLSVHDCQKERTRERERNEDRLTSQAVAS